MIPRRRDRRDGRKAGRHRGWMVAAGWLAVWSFPAWAGESRAADAPQPVIAVIIDDLGDRYDRGDRATALPGPVAVGVLPHTPYARQLARLAAERDKEVLVHMPMESIDGQDPGPGTLRLAMTRTEFDTAVQSALDSVPDAIGVNNHMGSLLTRHPGHMAWLMKSLTRYPAFVFVDSVTTHKTVATRLAREYGVPYARRNVFLDGHYRFDEIERQFDRLVELARRHGSALAIGHPHPATLEVLEERLAGLSGQGVRLVGIRTLIDRQREDEPWRAYSSR